MNNAIRHAMKKVTARTGRGLLGLATAVLLLLVAISCSTLNKPLVTLPEVPGLKYIGAKECEQCHDEIFRDFKTASHSHLMAKGPNALDAGCESCHGPGSAHADSGGEVKPPFSLSAAVAPKMSREILPSSKHTGTPDSVCYQCHADVRGQFNLPNHHPVPEGRISCTDCHDVHKGPAIKSGGTALLSQNAACIKCHEAQHGPFAFEHEALRDGCITCHNPHGSVNEKMLLARNQTLCMSCHFQEQTAANQIKIGGVDHTTRLSQGTCWTAGCHEAVHGSQVSSSLRF